MRVAKAEFTGKQLPDCSFALAAAGNHDVKWHEITDGTGKISAKIGQPGKNWVVWVSVWNQLLDDKQFVRVEILDSAHQQIARAFVGLYPNDNEKRREGELV